MGPKELIGAMRTSLEAGLSDREANTRLAKFGRNI